MFMSEILEIIMVISFGASWPFNIFKSYKAKTAKGKSLAFLCLITSGIISSLISEAGSSNFLAANVNIL